MIVTQIVDDDVNSSDRCSEAVSKEKSFDLFTDITRPRSISTRPNSVDWITPLLNRITSPCRRNVRSLPYTSIRIISTSRTSSYRYRCSCNNINRSNRQPRRHTSSNSNRSSNSIKAYSVLDWASPVMVSSFSFYALRNSLNLSIIKLIGIQLRHRINVMFSRLYVIMLRTYSIEI